MILNKKCRDCSVCLTIENAVKTVKNSEYYKSRCRTCYNKQFRDARVRKEYPCETCGTKCYKRRFHSFCSDKCRFLSHVTKTDTCWIWNGATIRGYGRLCFNNIKSAVATRVSYELFVGPIDKDLVVCHTCDVPLCVNPDHLWVGTMMEKTMDMLDKGRVNSKLNFKDVSTMRKLWSDGLSNAKLSEIFNVGRSTVSGIVHRKTWTYV
jgi:hypothetical protein